MQLFEGEQNMSIRIKNWSKLQHFKDRTPPWIKLYRDLLDDPDWHDLPGDDGKTLIGLWLIASEDETREGTLPCSRKLAFRLRVSVNDLERALIRLGHWLINDDIAVISPEYRSDAPETETETETKGEEETESECEGKPSAKAVRVKKPKGRNYGIAALGIQDEVMGFAEAVWTAWPKDGWNFSTKSTSPRRINRALFLERFQEILTHSPVLKGDGTRLTAEDLASAALDFVKGRVAEGRRDGSEIPNVPCIANFFSSCEGEKNPWKDAVLSYFGG